LAKHSKENLFGSLYAFAPDNLAWLWAFFDWERPLDLDKIETQDSYISLKGTQLNDEQTGLIAESPLIRYVYREKMMIADVFKLLEHVQNIQDVKIARALFCLYFPRFADYLDSPLKSCVKILKVNLSRIKSVDDILIALVRSRYTNLNEYKSKIRSGLDLPSYIRTLLSESNYAGPGMVKQSSSSKTSKKFHSSSTNNDSNSMSESSDGSLQNSFDIKLDNMNQRHSAAGFRNPTQLTPASLISNDNVFTELPEVVSDDEKYTNFFQTLYQCNSKKTNEYLSLLQNYKINEALDHVSFDSRLAAAAQQQQQQLGSQTTKQQTPLSNLDDNDLSTLTNSDPTTTDINNNFHSLSLNNNSSSSNSFYQNQSNFISATQQNLRNSRINSSNINETINESVEEDIKYIATNSKLRPTANVFKYNEQSQIQKQQTLFIPINKFNPVAAKKTTYDYESTPLSPTMLESNVWSNNNNSNNLNRSSRQNNIHTDNIINQAPTPPPSAKTLRSPLSILTNGGESTNSDLNIYSFTSPHHQMMTTSNNGHYLGLSGVNGDHSFHTESMKYIKASTFLSPAVRQSQNAHTKFADFSPYKSGGGSGPGSSSGNSSLNGSKLNLNNTSLNFNQNRNYNNSNSSNNNNSSASYINKSNSISMHHVWFGRLPPKVYTENSLYSRKVFLGGLPWDVNQAHLVQLLHKYGPVKLEIPGKDQKHPRASTMNKCQERSTPGYVYIIFEHESSVQRMLYDCRKDIKNGGEHYYYTIFVQAATMSQSGANSPAAAFNNFNGHHQQQQQQQHTHKRSKAKEVEVIPWNQEDTSYMPFKQSCQPAKIDARLTVFVGALHGMLNAQGLAKVMNEIIGEVTHAGLDSDKYKYPIGSGRVTFKNRASYVKAISAKFVTIKANMDPNDPSPKFEKTIQIDPYLEDAKCCQCDDKSQFFCRNENCLDYFCQQCWIHKHDQSIGNGEHVPLSRQNKTNHGF
jgi:cytoplasmic polyadenylation element-binding protein